LTDGVPETTQHVVEYMVAAYTEEEYEHVRTVWEHVRQDMQVARMLYGFGAFVAAAASDEGEAPLETADGEFYGPESDGDIDTDIARVNAAYDVFEGFASGESEESE
jgi:hypothetical protein